MCSAEMRAVVKFARCRDETISIGDDIEVTIVAIHDGWVQISVTAPKSVSVEREEARIRSRAVAVRRKAPTREDKHGQGT